MSVFKANREKVGKQNKKLNKKDINVLLLLLVKINHVFPKKLYPFTFELGRGLDFFEPPF